MSSTLPAGLSREVQKAPSPSWQSSLKKAIRSGRELCHRLGLDDKLSDSQAEQDFPILVPEEFFARMRHGDPQDPLLLQVLSSRQELRLGGARDPVGDLDCARADGLIQKYHGRVLLILSGACAVHCRYCFRRHFPYDSVPTSRQQWLAWLRKIADDSTIEEVILSGGDPLSVVDHRLSWLVEQLNAIPHVRRLRIHTRLPVVIPQRVCTDLLAWLSRSRPAVYFVVHINHPQEIDSDVESMLKKINAAGATLLNQAVLLRNVNDDANTLCELCLRLADNHVLPYYIHQLDRVQGGLHFEVSDGKAMELMSRLRSRLPGYALPQLVREVAGEASKRPVSMA